MDEIGRCLGGKRETSLPGGKNGGPNQVINLDNQSAKVQIKDRHIWKVDYLEYTHLDRQMGAKKNPDDGVVLCSFFSLTSYTYSNHVFSFFWLKSFHNFP